MIASHLHRGDTLRNGFVVTPSKGPEIISAEMLPPGAPAGYRGDILSFASAPTGYLAVDTNARADSSWPAAPFRVTQLGVIPSRGCVDDYRGHRPCGSGPGAAQCSGSHF